MIIKSMSRKHPSFNQIIDYIESERKLKSRSFSIYHNIYSRNSDQIKNEFLENSKHLRFRKNGVYLYHEVLSISKAKHIDEEKQKVLLQIIVGEYLKARAKNNLAYAVLHEDKTDNFHFHIVISANEAEDSNRKRLSKADFAEIQTRLEQWVLKSYPELEQKAVFYPNQTDQERAEQENKAHISNKGAELQRRTGTANKREAMQKKLRTIFEVARNGQHFSDMLKSEGLNLYQRGKQYGIIDRDGIKYRFSTLGLAEAWDALDKRMMENFQSQRTTQNNTQDTPKTADKPQEQRKEANTSTRENKKDTLKTEPPRPERQQQQEESMKQKPPNEDETTATGTSPFTVAKEFVLHPTDNPIEREMEEERQRRLAEAEAMREAKAKNQTSTEQRNSNKNQLS